MPVDNNDLLLILMRHAKSSWKSGAPTDHARPLNKRGTRDAPRVGLRLLSMGWRPDVVLSSDSQRTRLTVSGMFDGVPEPPPVEWIKEFYLGGIEEIRSAITQGERPRCVLVLGHNPGWEEALTWLSGSHERMTTGNAALLKTTETAWERALEQPRRFELLTIIRPRDMDA